QAAGFGRRIGRDGETTVGRDDPDRARDTGFGQLDLQLTGLGHGNQHRAQVEPGQLRDGGVVEVLDVERALEFFGSLVAGAVERDLVVRRWAGGGGVVVFGCAF